MPTIVVKKHVPKFPTEDAADKQVVHRFCQLATQCAFIIVHQPVATTALISLAPIMDSKPKEEFVLSWSLDPPHLLGSPECGLVEEEGHVGQARRVYAR
jgi:hypothetical protein